MDKIFDYDCEILDIKDRKGHTGYIDFIKQDEVTQDVMKGVDLYGRHFLVFKAKFIYDDKEELCFSTFFKRYIEIPVYHICGHDGRLLMETCGGMNMKQASLLEKLLNEKVVDINLDMIIDLKLNPSSFYNLNSMVPYQIKLGF